jgi:hypothetical protein
MYGVPAVEPIAVFQQYTVNHHHSFITPSTGGDETNGGDCVAFQKMDKTTSG